MQEKRRKKIVDKIKIDHTPPQLQNCPQNMRILVSHHTVDSSWKKEIIFLEKGHAAKHTITMKTSKKYETKRRKEHYVQQNRQEPSCLNPIFFMIQFLKCIFVCPSTCVFFYVVVFLFDGLLLSFIESPSSWACFL